MNDTKLIKSGFVAIIGRPNVGKSTTTNALVGDKVAIVSAKPQTTRNRIMGVVNGENYQIVLLDTPGIFTPHSELEKFMDTAVKNSLQSVDAVLLVLDGGKGMTDADKRIFESVLKEKNLVIGINKIDFATTEKTEEITEYISMHGDYAIIKFSARTGEGMAELKDKLLSQLPTGPRYFPTDEITDMPDEFITAEIIREKALILLNDEIPHGIGVGLERFFQRDDDIIEIHAVLYCERDSHKGIIIGKGGGMLKRISTAAREELEGLFGDRIFLRVFVKVRKDWRNDPAILKELGYR